MIYSIIFCASVFVIVLFHGAAFWIVTKSIMNYLNTANPDVLTYGLVLVAVTMILGIRILYYILTPIKKRGKGFLRRMVSGVCYPLGFYGVVLLILILGVCFCLIADEVIYCIKTTNFAILSYDFYIVGASLIWGAVSIVYALAFIRAKKEEWGSFWKFIDKVLVFSAKVSFAAMAFWIIAIL